MKQRNGGEWRSSGVRVEERSKSGGEEWRSVEEEKSGGGED